MLRRQALKLGSVLLSALTLGGWSLFRNKGSERATYNALNGVVEMTGNPEARDGGNVVRGTKVTFTVGNRRMQWVQPQVLITTPEDAGKLAVPPAPPKPR